MVSSPGIGDWRLEIRDWRLERRHPAGFAADAPTRGVPTRGVPARVPRRGGRRFFGGSRYFSGPRTQALKHPLQSQNSCQFVKFVAKNFQSPISNSLISNLWFSILSVSLRVTFF